MTSSRAFRKAILRDLKGAEAVAVARTVKYARRIVFTRVPWRSGEAIRLSRALCESIDPMVLSILDALPARIGGAA